MICAFRLHSHAESPIVAGILNLDIATSMRRCGLGAILALSFDFFQFAKLSNIQALILSAELLESNNAGYAPQNSKEISKLKQRDVTQLVDSHEEVEN